MHGDTVHINPKHVVSIQRQGEKTCVMMVNGYLELKNDPSELATEVFNRGGCKP
jgi:hypothetical protein